MAELSMGSYVTPYSNISFYITIKYTAQCYESTLAKEDTTHAEYWY